MNQPFHNPQLEVALQKLVNARKALVEFALADGDNRFNVDDFNARLKAVEEAAVDVAMEGNRPVPMGPDTNHLAHAAVAASGLIE